MSFKVSRLQGRARQPHIRATCGVIRCLPNYHGLPKQGFFQAPPTVTNRTTCKAGRYNKHYSMLLAPCASVADVLSLPLDQVLLYTLNLPCLVGLIFHHPHDAFRRTLARRELTMLNSMGCLHLQLVCFVLCYSLSIYLESLLVDLSSNSFLHPSSCCAQSSL